MKKRIWAVLCGMIRQEFELYNIISLLCDWRHKGMIEGIVISTWIGEPDVLPGFREKCKLLGVRLVESPPLENIENKYSNLGYFRQASQLNAALSRLPDDVWVLKCRTDFCIDAVYTLKEAFEADLTAKNIGAFYPVVSHKIAVFEISISHPFVFCDLSFFAHKSDMFKMIVFEDSFRLVKNGLAPDLLFFLNVVLHEYPFIADYLRTVDYWTFSNLLGKNFINYLYTFDEDGVYLPSLLNKLYALYLLIFDANFYLCSPKEYSVPSSFKFEDLFVPSSRNGVFLAWGIKSFNKNLIKAFIRGSVASSKGWNLISNEIQQLIRDEEYAFSLNVSLRDYHEMKKWGEQHLGLKDIEWIHWLKFDGSYKVNVSGKEADGILFSDYSINYKEEETIFHIWNKNQDGNANYYDTILQALPMLNKNIPLYEIALAACARKNSSAVFRIIAEDLAKERVSSTNEKALSMVIERMRRAGRIFERTGKDDFIMFFWYGKYRARKGDDFFNDVIGRICHKWSLHFDFDDGNQEENFIKVLNLLLDKLDERNLTVKNNIKYALEYIRSTD